MSLKHFSTEALTAELARRQITPARWFTGKRVITNDIARHVATVCQNAYSFEAFGAKNWMRIAELLAARGLNSREIEAVLRSKTTRWARDSYEGKAGWGAYPAKCVIDYLDKNETADGIAALVEGTFGA